MKKIDVGSFIDSSIVDLEERSIMWEYALSSYCGQWDRVLRAKWILASIQQGRIQSEVR